MIAAGHKPMKAWLEKTYKRGTLALPKPRFRMRPMVRFSEHARPRGGTDESSLGERIRAAREASGWTQQQLGDALDISSQAVSQWEKNKTKPSLSALVRLSNELGCSLTELAGVKKGSVKDIIDRYALVENSRHQAVPIYALEELIDREPKRLPDRDANVVLVSLPFPPKGKLKAFKVVDESMHPDILMGDFLIVDEGISPRPSDIVVAVTGNPAKTVVRKWRLVRENSGDADKIVELVPSNTDYPTEILALDKDDVVLGVLVEQRRFRQRN